MKQKKKRTWVKAPALPDLARTTKCASSLFTPLPKAKSSKAGLSSNPPSPFPLTFDVGGAGAPGKREVLLSLLLGEKAGAEALNNVVATGTADC